LTRRLAVLLVVALTTAPQLFAGKVWLKNVAAAQKEAKAQNQLILVDMFAEWCGWCHRFEQEVFPSAVFQDATKDIILLRLDTEDGKEGTQFARKYAVTSLPTFLLLAPDLSIAGLLRGYAPPNDFAESLKDTRKKYADFTRRAKNESAIANDPVARRALAKEFTQRSAYDKAEARLKKLMAEKNLPVAIRDEAYYNLAINYTVQGKYTEALATIRQLNTLSKLGESVEGARMLAGQIYMQQGNLLGAANEFRSLKKAFPNSSYIPQIEVMLPEIERRLASSSGK
jgi:thioredoxin-related protein